MERKSKEKPERKKFEDLTRDESLEYYGRAKYLVENGYIMDKTTEQVAREIYASKWRVSTS